MPPRSLRLRRKRHPGLGRGCSAWVPGKPSHRSLGIAGQGVGLQASWGRRLPRRQRVTVDVHFPTLLVKAYVAWVAALLQGRDVGELIFRDDHRFARAHSETVAGPQSRGWRAERDALPISPGAPTVSRGRSPSLVAHLDGSALRHNHHLAVTMFSSGGNWGATGRAETSRDQAAALAKDAAILRRFP